ncbi:GntP family permease [Sphingomonas oligoaromativorans]|jgi:GntP family gluconate:H+ symporter|uniref:GntP family permease n=1 Tax=Sphingomonas oligoaromativorans TaxID=575322 RepID=UPI0014225174|nr:gluconate:H+ symporter [Sphingomonas oligoaromativorans]NIJ35191.1 GntP family gluconate:H+ symporter [Sphingomonas oligoaromativorans]
MTAEDARLIVSAIVGIALAVGLIVKGRLHPFVGLLCGAFTVGLLAGIPTVDAAKAVEKGVGDILGGTGLVVALGLSLGAMLQLSNGASSLAHAVLRLTGDRGAPWLSLLAAMVIGLPLFFETGLVLLLPITMAVAASLPEAARSRDAAKLRLVMPALAGLSVLHALVPPHPGPLLAVNTLGADLGRTIVYGLIVAIPTAILSGPVLSRFTTRGITLSDAVIEAPETEATAPNLWLSLLVLLMPVVLIASAQVLPLLPASLSGRLGGLSAWGHPVLALLVTNLLALPLLFGRRMMVASVQERIWTETMKPAGAILLAIGAGGALKQVLVTAGLSTLLARWAETGGLSPILLAWMVAVGVRLATGSATVATITTAGIMSGVAATTGVSPEWLVLAIGAGSIFFSHVNDPGFWLVKSYVGTSTADTFRTWSVMETAVSVLGLIFILIVSQVLA